MHEPTGWTVCTQQRTGEAVEDLAWGLGDSFARLLAAEIGDGGGWRRLKKLADSAQLVPSLCFLWVCTARLDYQIGQQVAMLGLRGGGVSGDAAGPSSGSFG